MNEQNEYVTKEVEMLKKNKKTNLEVLELKNSVQ